MELRDLVVAILTSEEARERDRLAIEAGTPSRVLMQNAGVAAAMRIVHHFRGDLSTGVEIHTGPGNNGGDGWVVAAELTRQGVPVNVVEAEPPRTADAINARDSTRLVQTSSSTSRPGIVVDALLGTGSRGELKGVIRNAVNTINAARRQGAKVVALDIPTGVDANSGATGEPVVADLTLSFGSAKRGHLIARASCGIIEILDIGLGAFGSPSEGDVALASPDWVAAHILRIAPDSHKGTRRRLAIIAGDVGMAGAAILAGRGALRSGIGLLRLIVAKENRDSAHVAVPAALVSTHDDLLADPAGMLSVADTVVIGPGLRAENAARLLAAVPKSVKLVVLDAGALAAIDNNGNMLQEFCAGREVVLTPHPAEMGKMLGLSTADILERRFDIGLHLASVARATVLLKGTPTIVSHSERGGIATATGTAALATGGSGDVLSGMIGTLLAQTGNGFDSAVCGAWVHGRAAELCGSVRGVTLDDILFAMPAAWSSRGPLVKLPVLASLPFVQ
ncbi:MAG: NAD(P)H-hydrate dehydratase [Gemmatimonadaceae bacterium]|nr:NAD(P)H-hydrate dehydratase [Gemmatimonadaceae bacterium]